MPFALHIPQPNVGQLSLTVEAGECVFCLGANGTGKSALMLRLYQGHHQHARRIAAHRQTWFSSNILDLSPNQKRNSATQIQSHDTNDNSRWMEYQAEQRANIAIYDLIDGENVRARSITRAVDDDDIDLAKELRKREAPIKVINELLRHSNMPIEIAVKENDRLVARKSGSDEYSVAQLSDGERSALLIAANVLTAKPGTLILIDEPERHLHRSIISPLLTQLFAKRPDCAFVISTHDVMLPLDNATARTLLIRGCNAALNTWEIDVVQPGAAIDDDLKKDILGARRKILFVEGSEHSLDKSLYTLVFPNVSVSTKATCRGVENAVSAVRESDDLHWLKAFGIVDSDGRGQADIDQLKAHGIYALSVFSVESIYYHPELQRRIAERQAGVLGGDAGARLADARTAALGAITPPHIGRLSARAVERQLRQKFMTQLPKWNQLAGLASIDVSVNVTDSLNSERTRLQAALDAADLSALIANYPVRETPALTQIADRLGFQSREQYEAAVRKLLMDDADTLTFVRSLFGTLAADIAAA